MMSGGLSVELDGTPDEVTAVVESLRKKTHPLTAEIAGKRVRKFKGEIPDLIDHLRAEEFFKTPHGLGDIQKKLAEMGHHYPVTTLSGAMQAQARNRTLRRFKHSGKYVYVQ
jgi:superfamily II DNA/RNA helicase